MRFMLLLLAALALSVTPVFAQMGGGETQSPGAADTGSDPMGAPAGAETGTDPMAAPESADPMAQTEIQATVTSVDQAMGELIVNEAGGAERTFQVSDTQQLQDLQEGDQIKITPDPNDPNKAQSVEKQDQEQNQGLF